MTCAPLTPRQSQLLAFLTRCQYSPSYQEMARELGLASRSGIARLLDGLEARGFIRRSASSPRSIELIESYPVRSAPTDELVAELRRRGFDVSAPRHAERNAA